MRTLVLALSLTLLAGCGVETASTAASAAAVKAREAKEAKRTLDRVRVQLDESQRAIQARNDSG